ncbi:MULTISPECIES: alpha/beta hydrolase [Furfurilactobacillus]|uniref:Alpha/beta hydrolase n=2 Tax=Furfurilactobacillus TaxID=2767882 RepID=A0ABT6DC96_9LACO|nr:alpha/beta hydrolase [Furfurilactobacillus milii]QLE65668.1 Cell surface hydrolase membrane-bound [Furfurilactobacillus rossiae]MCF6161852.1 alpha/beta hydrolase [Furfurilactobacillus milii]MCF6164232.1 alpha/beta hydrolase [Furfurilactobacillus milii]MDF9914774.1 alpha/beta hydrolase [Furfurilactobacillus milii]MYV06048.1 alpha/beta hydrolase [Furfurilactobacillus milii]
MHRRIWTITSALVLMLGASFVLFHKVTSIGVTAEPLKSSQVNKSVIQTHTPTIFMPGWATSANSFNAMIGYMQGERTAGKVMRINVDFFGRIHVIGRLKKTDINPLIQVTFDRNLGNSYQPQAKWLNQILMLLKRRYHVNEYNAVGHSWGGSAMVTQLIRYGNDERLPKLHKMVLLSAPVDESIDRPKDVLPSGKPKRSSHSYRQLIAARNNLWANSQAQIFNVYGSANGEDTDNSVPIVQAQALRYLVHDIVPQYHEILMKNTNHHQIHTTIRSYKLVTNLLFGKPGSKP